MGIFREENRQIVIDPEIKLIREFAKLISRDKDAKKRNAYNELAFIYFVADYKSPYSIFPKDERIAKVKIQCKFPPDWEPDAFILAALAKYEEFQQTPALRSLIAMRDSLLTSTKVVEVMRNSIEQILNNSGDEDEQVDPAQLVQNVARLLELADKLPKAISTIETLEEKVKKEQSGEKKIRGGGESNEFEQ